MWLQKEREDWRQRGVKVFAFVLNEYHYAYAEGGKSWLELRESKTEGRNEEDEEEKKEIDTDILLSEKKTNDRVRIPKK